MLEKGPSTQDGVDGPPKIGSSNLGAGENGIFGCATTGDLAESSLREGRVASIVGEPVPGEILAHPSNGRPLQHQADKAMNGTSSLPAGVASGEGTMADGSSDFVKGGGEEEESCSEGLIESIFGGLLRSDVTCKVTLYDDRNGRGIGD